MTETPPPRRTRNGPWATIFIKFFVVLIICVLLALLLISIYGISTGSPYIVISRFGYSGKEDTDAFNKFGPGAYAASSILYLTNLGYLVPLLVLVVAVLFAARGAATRWISRVGGVIAVAAAIATIIWISVAWASGVPYENFNPTANNTQGYVTAYILPVAVLVLIGYLVYYPRRKLSGRAAEIAAHEIHAADRYDSDAPPASPRPSER